MNRAHPRSTPRLGVLALLATGSIAPLGAMAQDADLEARAMGLLEQTVERYRAFDSYQDVLHISVESDLEDSMLAQLPEDPYRLWYASPNRIRLDADPLLLVGDGQHMTVCLRTFGQYVEIDADDAARIDELGGPLEDMMVAHPVAHILLHRDLSAGELWDHIETVTAIEDAVHEERSASIIRGTMRFESTDDLELPFSLWIDQDTHLIDRFTLDIANLRNRIFEESSEFLDEEELEDLDLRRTEKAEMNFRFDEVQVNEPIDDSRFVFSPPAGAEKVETFSPPWLEEPIGESIVEAVVAEIEPGGVGAAVQLGSDEISVGVRTDAMEVVPQAVVTLAQRGSSLTLVGDADGYTPFAQIDFSSGVTVILDEVPTTAARGRFQARTVGQQYVLAPSALGDSDSLTHHCMQPTLRQLDFLAGPTTDTESGWLAVPVERSASYAFTAWAAELPVPDVVSAYFAYYAGVHTNAYRHGVLIRVDDEVDLGEDEMLVAIEAEGYGYTASSDLDVTSVYTGDDPRGNGLDVTLESVDAEWAVLRVGGILRAGDNLLLVKSDGGSTVRRALDRSSLVPTTPLPPDREGRAGTDTPR